MLESGKSSMIHTACILSIFEASLLQKSSTALQDNKISGEFDDARQSLLVVL